MAVAVFVVITAAGIGLGVLSSGADAATPVVGTVVLALYAAAVVGIGHAIGGVFGARFAAPIVVVFVIITWGIQLLGPVLGIPDVVRELALTSHVGQSMVGVWDPDGIVASIVIAIGGAAIGTWGFSRRDIVR